MLLSPLDVAAFFQKRGSIQNHFLFKSSLICVGVNFSFFCNDLPLPLQKSGLGTTPSIVTAAHFCLFGGGGGGDVNMVSSAGMGEGTL